MSPPAEHQQRGRHAKPTDGACSAESKAALSCAVKHEGDKTPCGALFQIYKACRKTEGEKVIADRKAKNTWIF